MANAGDELYRLMHDEDKIDIPKSKTRKQKKKDTEGGHMKKPTFQGNNDPKVTDGFRRVLKGVLSIADQEPRHR